MAGVSIGAELRSMRTQRGLSLVEASRRSGISRKTLQRWESDEHAPRGEALAALLTTLEATPHERAALLADVPIAQARSAMAMTALGSPAHPGQILRAVRERQGITQTQLAHALGVSQAAVAKWESGHAAPSADTFGRLTAILGVENFGLRENSLELYDPITSPYDARIRIREISSGRPDSVARLMAVERELWPLAARDPQWAEALVETLAYRAWAHLELAEFSVGLEVAQRAVRLAESEDGWDVVFRAVEAIQAIRHKRGADPVRNARFILDCAHKVREPFARATLLNRAGWLAWEFDPARTERLFRESEDLVRNGDPSELAGYDYPDGPISLEDLDRWGVSHAIARRDVRMVTEYYERSYAADWERRLEEAGSIDVATIVVDAHLLAGSRPPDIVLEWLDTEARRVTDFWSTFNIRKINVPLGLFAPNVPNPR
jgi:transcriptional regulator with XRE-family HTH domain